MTNGDQDSSVKKHAICISKDRMGYRICHGFYQPFGADTSLLRPYDRGYIQFQEAVNSLIDLPDRFYLEGADIEFALGPRDIPSVPKAERDIFGSVVRLLERSALVFA